MAPATARAALESLLRTRKLDTTLTTVLPLAPRHEDDVIPTGLAGLDAQLAGGLPRGQLSELVGPRSSGRTSLLQAIVAGHTRRGELVAVIDTLDRWDPAGLAARGADLTRVLWIRGRDVPLSQLSLAPDWEPSRPGGRRRSHVAQALDRAVKAAMLVLNAGGFGLVALDLADVPLAVVRELPFTTWMRLQRVIEGSGTACVLLAAEPLARSAGGASIRLGPTSPTAHGPAEVSGDDVGPGLDAPAFHAHVHASRRPYLGRRPPPRNALRRAPASRSAARWTTNGRTMRRLSGLVVEATIVRAHRSGQVTARVPLSFGR